jgi:hypothetical protein
MKTFAAILTILPMLVLTGCVGGVSNNVNGSHPANPQAQQSPVAPTQPMLLAGSQSLVLPVATNDAAMRHEHHQTTPAKPAQKPADHQHEHGPKEEKK